MLPILSPPILLFLTQMLPVPIMQLCIIDMYVVISTKLKIVENTGHATGLCIILDNVPVTQQQRLEYTTIQQWC